MHSAYRIGIWFVSFLILSAAGPAALSAESGETPLVVRGDSEYPPYEYTDKNGEPTGFNVALIQAVAEEMHMDIALSLAPWNTVRRQLESGEIDILTGMFYSNERDRRVDFSVPHTIISHTAFVRQNSSIQSPEDLEGKKIIVQRGDIMHDYVTAKGLTTSVHPVDNPETALALLASGLYDAALLSRLQGLYLIKKNRHDNLRDLDATLEQSKYCFAVPKGRADLLATINEGLFILKTRGIYRDIYQDWFGVYEEPSLWESAKYVFLGLSAALLLLTAALIWSYSLKKQVAQRTRDLESTVNELKRITAVLKETEDRFQLAVRASSVGLWNWDDIRKDRVWWAPQVYEMLGYKEGEIEPSFSQLIQLTHPDDREKAKQAIASHLKYQTPYNFEHRLRKKKGMYGWFRAMGQSQRDEDGRAVRMAGSIQDITALKRSESDRIQLATAVEQTEEGIIISDAEGKIHYVNPAFVRMTGYEINDLPGRDFLRLESDTEAHPESDAIRQTLLDGNTWKGRLTYPGTRGASIHMETTISPIRDAFGRITNFVAVYRDVTRERELENRLRQSQKMEAIGTLAGGIAHDFNNILYAIIGYTELAITGLDAKSRLNNHLTEVLTAAWRARDLVKQILSFSRHPSAQDFSPIHVKFVVEEALSLIRATLPSSVEIRQIMETSRLVKADPTQIHQVVMNLCTNAAHAMSEKGGILTVRVRDIMLDAKFTDLHPDLTPGTYVQLTTEDTGCGISPEILDRIFDPFFTTKKIDKGSGLGLAVVHGIVKNHGGAINVQSQPEQGTKVDIYLPAIQAIDRKLPLAPSSTPGGNEHILFVDDEPAIAIMAEQMLENLGYTVTTRTDPRDALDYFSADPERIDLVITDRTMPHMTGDQLAESIRVIRPGIPVIFCSGIQDEIVGSATEMPDRTFLLKPIDHRELARTIRSILDASHQKNNLPHTDV